MDLEGRWRSYLKFELSLASFPSSLNLHKGKNEMHGTFKLIQVTPLDGASEITVVQIDRELVINK